MKLKNTNLFIISTFLVVGVAAISLSCENSKVAEGEKLAQQYCSSCHLLPSPDMLPKNVWQYSTLPYMGIMMGVETEINGLEKPLSDYAILRPASQMISDEDWLKIKRYYLAKAPKTLEFPKYEALEELKDMFLVQQTTLAIKGATIPNFTAVCFDTLNRKIIAGDQSNHVIWVLDQNGETKQSILNQHALTNVDLAHADKQDYLFTYIGTTTQANPDVNGSAEQVSLANNTFKFQQKLLPNLNRPIEVLSKNLDDSPEDELISNEFGFKAGGLSIWKKDAKNQFQRKQLSTQTGATKTIIMDFNGDKRNDILALFAQGDEQIILYLNKGNLNFEAKQLLRFPSIYGTSSFDIADINRDGKFDIVCTAGDNADFSTILKPYHGVYVYTNTGNFTFKQSHFFQQNGATKVIPRDFDNDGDIDMASVALFPDTDHRPLEGFMYFENTGDHFKQKTLPINHLGRWSVMDAADIDHDGDIDMVLGSHPVAKFPAGFDQAWKQGSGLIILRNKTY
ncbi:MULTISPECIES: VCBS repeat-containing protein [Emticicia]|uniref:FG-GAP repeat domain-containing protein n=1 Tax=Emticicia TaxID=312278 RepID=UPI0007D89918|nr:MULTISPECIES: VCBS repeat-containing protein [Emticicia]